MVLNRDEQAEIGRSAIKVIAYSGYCGEQEPRELIVGGELHRVITIDERWIEPGARCFRVRTSDGHRLLLRYDLGSRVWQDR